MQASEWEEAKRLFAAALPLELSGREALLATACAGRERLLEEVRSLIDAHERAGQFLETGPAATRAAPPADDLLGRRLGPYLIESVLGRGGMGVVYRARRESPSREVAIKLVRLDVGPGGLARRFELEGRVLARLDHPHVARLFDVGTAPDGRSYCVLELVEGRPIDQHCAQRRLDLRSRLDLFLKVCGAVSYAHGRLVVHRDIKPANVLVTADGSPKLLDFGIAHLLDEGLGTGATLTGLRLMTPEYASPEQMRGEPATVATDVHALGLLLHLLATGRGPFQLRSGAPEELVRVICLDDAPAPSTDAQRPRAGAIGFDPPEPARRLGRLLRGDLDSIVAQALRKEPERRYASVEQLAEDVQRHLDGRPVLARGGRWRYRLGKFVRRNRTAVALGTALLLALCAGLAAAVWQARLAQAQRARAERRFADVRRLSTSFLFEFEAAIRDLPGSTRAREMLVQKALEHLDDLAAEARHDTGLQRELGAAYGKLADVQGGVGVPSLGDRTGAERSLRKAIGLLDAAAPTDGEGLALLAKLHHRLGRLLSKEQRAKEALHALEQARRLAARAAPLLPVAVGAEQQAETLHALALVRGENDDTAGEIELLREALAGLDRLASRERSAPAVRFRAGAILGELGQALDALDRPAAALPFLERSAEQRRADLAAEPLSTTARLALARDLFRLSHTLHALDDFPRANEAAAESQGLFARLAEDDPQDVQARTNLGRAQLWVCTTRMAAGQLEAARRACGQALQAAETAAAQKGRSAHMDWELLFGLQRTGQLERRAGRADLALAYVRRALPLAETLTGKPGVAQLHVDEAQALRDLRRRSEAVSAARSAVELLERVTRESPQGAQTWRRELAEAHELLADLLLAAGGEDAREAAPHYHAALDGFLALQREGRLLPRLVPRLERLAKRLEVQRPSS